MNIKDIFAQHNLIIQEGSYTCGPVSLLNILHLKGDFSHTEADLTKLCKAKPGIGTPHDDLISASQKLGLKLVEQKEPGSYADIERNIDAGAFVIVNYSSAFSGNGHYSVVTEYDDGAFYFRDSAYGLLRLSKEYFEKFWYGADGSKKWYVAIK